MENLTAPVIALTFDDGPNTSTTVEILDILERYHVVASFFVIGENINHESVKVMKRACDLGCEINSHSFSHRDMRHFTVRAIQDEMRWTDEKIMAVTHSPVKYFRPPYLHTNSLIV